jgi:hypothetical protein
MPTKRMLEVISNEFKFSEHANLPSFLPSSSSALQLRVSFDLLNNRLPLLSVLQ